MTPLPGWHRLSMRGAKEHASIWEGEWMAPEGAGMDRIQNTQGGIELRSGTRVVFEDGRGFMIRLPVVRA